jgi:hypothetical protein
VAQASLTKVGSDASSLGVPLYLNCKTRHLAERGCMGQANPDRTCKIVDAQISQKAAADLCTAKAFVRKERPDWIRALIPGIHTRFSIISLNLDTYGPSIYAMVTCHGNISTEFHMDK